MKKILNKINKQNCINCGRCISVCPMINNEKLKQAEKFEICKQMELNPYLISKGDP